MSDKYLRILLVIWIADLKHFGRFQWLDFWNAMVIQLLHFVLRLEMSVEIFDFRLKSFKLRGVRQASEPLQLVAELLFGYV